MRTVSWLVAVLIPGLIGCGPTISELPPDRYPQDAWRGEAIELPFGRVEQDTLDPVGGDHTDWKVLHADRRGTVLLKLNLWRTEDDRRSSGHLQILNPQQVAVLNLELTPDREAYEVEIPMVHPGPWLIGLSLRGGKVRYELLAVWR